MVCFIVKTPRIIDTDIDMAVALRLRAVRATLSITAAGFQTALPSYFTHRDLFPSLMKVC